MDGHWGRILSLLAVLLLVLLNGFFVAAEFALVSVRKTRIEQLANEGNRRARVVKGALGKLDTYIAATQLGITMASLALGSIGEPAVSELLQPLFDRFLPAAPAKITAHGVSIAFAFAVVTSLHIVLGELAPKSIALQRPDTTALAVTGPLKIFVKVFRPFIYILNATGSGVVRLLGLQPTTEHANVHSVEELELLVKSSRKAGVLEEQQEKMVSGVFEFPEIPVHRVMTPRRDIIAVEISASTADALKIIGECGHARLPIFEGDIDNIAGIVHVKDLIRNMTAPSPVACVSELMREPFFVPENKRADYLLAELRRNRLQMAVVSDEYGGTAGIVTIEDLLEEIVGDIQDEYAAPEHTPEQVDDRTYLVDGRMPIGDLNDTMDIELPRDDADTIAGFVFNLLGHQPREGEETEWEGVQFHVSVIEGRVIRRVKVTKPLPDPVGQLDD